MTNPTTPFSWQMPTASDLVTDLPADFEVFGQAVATSLADLLGGTTGQVLAKASNTNMDFTWVAQDDSNAIQNAIVDAKGDLIAASAADTPARLPVGTNGQVLTADSTAATGLAWATAASSSGPAFRAFRNTSAQTFSQSTMTKVQFNGETFDTDNCFDSTTNYRFTPTKAGYYQVQAGLLVECSPVELVWGRFYKNGTGSTTMFYYKGGQPEQQFVGNDLIYMNGTTDYLEVYIRADGSSARSIGYGASDSYFSGVWIRS